MIKLFSKTQQYRVVEFTDKNDNRRFLPERRVLYFFWEGFVRDGYEVLKETFKSLDEANKFLYHYHTHPEDRKKKKKKTENKVTHEFNELFYRLKK